MNFSNSKKVTNATMKATIMKANNWTEDQYSKQYHLFKNKLRAYESFMYAHGRMVRVQSPSQLLYAQARSKLRYGSKYEPSEEMKRIQAFSAVSITKGRKLATAKGSRYEANILRRIERQDYRNFENLITKTKAGREIWDKIEDPLKREEALKDLSEYIKNKRYELNNGKFSNEFSGSDELSDDFDYSKWLD